MLFQFLLLTQRDVAWYTIINAPTLEVKIDPEHPLNLENQIDLVEKHELFKLKNTIKIEESLFKE